MRIKMTEELAQRIQARSGKKASLTDQQQIELIADWLGGSLHKELAAKYNTNLKTVGKVLAQAKESAAKFLEGQNTKATRDT